MTIRLVGHRLETIAVRGGLVAECSCNGGTVLAPLPGPRVGPGSIRLNLHPDRDSARRAHEAHKQSIKDGETS